MSEKVAVEVAKAEPVKVEPTLAEIRSERKAAEAERARIQAEREENARVAEKRRLIGEVLNMEKDINAKLDRIKEQKKLLKAVRDELKAANEDTDLTAEDLRELLARGRDAYHGSSVKSFADGGIIATQVRADELPLALKSILTKVVNHPDMRLFRG